jgi:hypothetical protein
MTSFWLCEKKRPVHQRYITEEQSSEKPPPNAVHAALCKSQIKPEREREREREEIYIQSKRKVRPDKSVHGA